MSTAAVALIGVVVGAILAGAANLVLAWRSETVAARAGVEVLLELLNGASRTIESTTNRWWPPALSPATETWEPYRDALAARLSPDLLVDVEKTMAALNGLNALAARQYERVEFYRARVLDARLAKIERTRQSRLDVRSEGEAEAKQRRVVDEEAEEELSRVLHPLLPSIEVAPRDIKRLQDAKYQLDQTINRLNAVSFLRWHWRPLVAAATVVAGVLAGAALGLFGGSAITSNSVAHTLAKHRRGEALTSCERVSGHAATWNCVVTFQQNGRTCSADAGSILVASTTLVAGSAGGKGCGSPVTSLEEWLIRTANDEDCVLGELIDASTSGSKQHAPPNAGGTAVEPIPREVTPSNTFTDCVK